MLCILNLNEIDGKNGMIVAARIAREVLVVEKRMRGNQVVESHRGRKALSLQSIQPYYIALIWHKMLIKIQRWVITIAGSEVTAVADEKSAPWDPAGFQAMCCR